MHESLLQILRCPEDLTPLVLANADLMEKVNRAIEAGKLYNLAGGQIELQLQSGLVRESGDRLYPVIEGIPTLIANEAIPLNQLKNDHTQ